MKTPTPWVVPQTPFTLAQVAPLGITERMLRTALAAGGVTRLRQGVYVASAALPTDPISLHVLRALAEQVAAPGRVASHETAALAHGIALGMTQRAAAGAVQLSHDDSDGARSQRRPGRSIHLRPLPAHHRVTLPSGLVVTSRARTAVDLASRSELPEGLMALDAAARMEFHELTGSTDPRHYDNVRLRCAAIAPLVEASGHVSVHRGSALVSTALTLVDVRRESPLESFSGAHFHLAGLPRSVPQARVHAAGRSYRVDDLWEEYGVVGEADGKGKYADPDAYVAEKIREQNLTDEGLLVVRWVGQEAFPRPGVVVQRVGRALMSRGWPGVQSWPGVQNSRESGSSTPRRAS